MGQIDMTEKLLADYNDVFADIVNVLLFNGERVIHENALVDTKVRSQYKALDGKIHEHERDVAKIATDHNVKIAMFGFEHQTKADKNMPFRIIGYDGASYRSQILKNSDERYPVITMVLYFGTTPWNKGRTLHDALDIPEKLKPYVSNYEINVFEIAFLAPETVAKFTSDFRIVADYFVQNRITKNYNPGKDTARHVDEVLKLMTALTGDNGFADNIKNVKKEGAIMCEVMERIREDSKEEGRKEERERLQAEMEKERRSLQAEMEKERRSLQAEIEKGERGRLSMLHNMIQHNFPKETIISLGYTEEEFIRAAQNSNQLRTAPSRMEF